MSNLLEEKLRKIQKHKSELKKEMKDERDRRRLMRLAEELRNVNLEEKSILRELGVD